MLSTKDRDIFHYLPNFFHYQPILMDHHLTKIIIGVKRVICIKSPFKRDGSLGM